jgi:mono/diheme cytochrome c family protein
VTTIPLHSTLKTARITRGLTQCRLFNVRLPTVFALAFSVLGTSSPALAQNYFEKGHSPSFTEEQAERGKTAYTNSCANCHGTDLNDGEFGPALKGFAFQQKWGAQSAAALLSYMQQKMPPASPGQLSARTYADLEAYILDANGLEPGTTELSAAKAAAPAGAPVGATKETFQRDVFPAQGNRDAIYKAAMKRRRTRESLARHGQRPSAPS